MATNNEAKKQSNSDWITICKNTLVNATTTDATKKIKIIKQKPKFLTL